MDRPDDGKRRDVQSRFLDKLRSAGFNFAAGVEYVRVSGASVRCGGCARLIPNGEQCSLEPAGLICAECAAGVAAITNRQPS